MNDANVFLLGASKGEEKGLFKGQNREIALPEAMQMKNTEKPITCLHLLACPSVVNANHAIPMSVVCEGILLNWFRMLGNNHFPKLTVTIFEQTFISAVYYIFI